MIAILFLSFGFQGYHFVFALDGRRWMGMFQCSLDSAYHYYGIKSIFILPLR